MFGRRNNPEQNLLQPYVGVIDEILTATGVDPNAARMGMQEGFGWSFEKGSALIEIYLAVTDGRGYFQVLSPLMHLPENRLLPLYRRLLEYNMQLTNASLGVYNDLVYVFSERPIEGLDANEANFMIQVIAEYADDLDNVLVSQYGGRLYSQA